MALYTHMDSQACSKLVAIDLRVKGLRVSGFRAQGLGLYTHNQVIAVDETQTWTYGACVSLILCKYTLNSD